MISTLTAEMTNAEINGPLRNASFMRLQVRLTSKQHVETWSGLFVGVGNTPPPSRNNTFRIE